jgi:acetyl-CoA carboxylase carboxyl transferase subunit alpha
MGVTAPRLRELELIDGIIPEPLGGAHRAPDAVLRETGKLIDRTMVEFGSDTIDFREQRREKYLAIGRSL